MMIARTPATAPTATAMVLVFDEEGAVWIPIGSVLEGELEEDVSLDPPLFFQACRVGS